MSSRHLDAEANPRPPQHISAPVEKTGTMPMPDQFAMMAMQGMVSTIGQITEVNTPYFKMVARRAYRFADAMLAARVASGKEAA